jgi:tRNA threonylcarbamoyladenosine biosynthesis protein TsaE
VSRREIETASTAETEAIGAQIAGSLRPGDVVLVSGEMGAGKTTLIRGACRALGVTEPVTSPTFTIGQTYAGDIPVSHLDLWRLGPDGVSGEEPALLADYLTPEAVAFMEWPEAVAPRLGSVTLRVSIAHAGGDRRRIELG